MRHHAPSGGGKGACLHHARHRVPALPVLADWLRIEQVLGNLFSNALKFTDHGTITLTVHHRPARSPGGHEITFAVSDTGIGIEPDQLPRLFNPFSQVDSSLSRRYGGSGLGLVIVRRLCELMGGTVSLDSRPGLGSVFTATVEVGDIPAPSEQTSGGAESPAAVIPATLHVLIVEDNPLNQKLLSRLIEQHGWTAEIAAHGVEAVEMTARRSFDLIFMDVSMPGMDGLEATRAIRTRERKNGEPPAASSPSPPEFPRPNAAPAPRRAWTIFSANPSPPPASAPFCKRRLRGDPSNHFRAGFPHKLPFAPLRTSYEIRNG